MAKTATDPGYAACPIRNIVDRFGDKWSLLVLYNLHTGGRLRFSEIHRRMTDISQKSASRPKLSTMFSVASVTARSEESTEQTFRAPPAMA